MMRHKAEAEVQSEEEVAQLLRRGAGAVAAASTSYADPPPPPRSLSQMTYETWRTATGLGSAALYAVTSGSMNFVNKATLRHFSLVNTLLLLQMLAAIAIIVPLRQAKVVTFPPFNLARARALLPITVLYTANVGFALLGLQSLNIPMYNALKRLTPVTILIVKAVVTRKVPPLDISASVVCIVAGCVVASAGDFTAELIGYAYALTSVSLQCVYLILVERSGAEKGATTTELLFYNSVLSLPFLVVIIAGMGEVPRIMPTVAAGVDALGFTRFCSLVATCSLMGVLLNFSLFLCTTQNSALTTTIVGVLKSVLSTFLGFFLLGGVKFHPLLVAGIGLNTAGGVWYSAVKYRQKATRQQPPQPPQPLHKDLSYTPLSNLDADLEGGAGGGDATLRLSSVGAGADSHQRRAVQLA